ncbi:hypothetical protein [Stygiolobus caldivivus]|uniref:ATPase n=1 Tax=Stygiolobus caldivivus TaxID=2824673 RepID=A0A8D5U4F1_9CREN|nr:hypothetical protein [Stygiolobus caldivivus]BCU69221.1 hypothetical protein KN1_05180 [Stygiolobus caldivivus]
MRLLISGLLQFDSGKTSFSLSLISALKDNGINIFPHKPVAGHNAWYSFYTMLRSEELNELVGNDALKYYDEISESQYVNDKKEIIREINPFAVLLAVPDIEKLNFNVRLYRELMSEGIIVTIRVSDCNSSIHFSLSDIQKVIPSPLAEKILHLNKVLGAVQVEGEKLKELLNSSPNLTEKCTQNIFHKYENVIIESYNDALAPNFSSLNADMLFIVSPGKVLLVDDFKDIAKLFSYPPWLIPVSSFMKYVRAVRAWDVEPGNYKVNESLLDFILKFIDINE